MNKKPVRVYSSALLSLSVALGKVVLATAASAILPAGSVKDETTFFVLIGMLAALIGVALYLRHKRNSEPEYPTE
ncbi:MAG TPA: LPXTG cell wall anchor domain-containing protein [Nitrososphaera sp.]|nr:LPXTG cell wall anchor domain-containing protein [Nitrososphaera sp.]